jgi:hypothetical protein
MNKISLFGVIIFVFVLISVGPTAKAQCREEHITQKLRAVYISASEPDTSFFDNSNLPTELTELLEELKRKGFDWSQLREQEDPSFAIKLKLRESTKTWRLLVSKVGKYAALFRLDETSNTTRFISDRITPGNDQILATSIKTKYCLLTREMLRKHSHIRDLRDLRAPIIFWQLLFRASRAVPPEITG